MSAGFVPDFIAPQPGERDSLSAIFACLDETTTALETESLLHLEMYADPGHFSDMMVKIRDKRQRIQSLEVDLEQRATEVLD